MSGPQNPRVTQADRERASGFFSRGAPEQACLAGQLDDRPIVQAFARHREAAEAASKAREAALVEALEGAIPALEQDYEQAQEYGDADWEGLAYQRLHAARAALTKEPDA